MAAPELMLISLDQIKEIVGIPAGTTTYDAAINAAAPIVTEMMENYCHRGLAYNSGEVEEFTIDRRLPLFRYPIAAVVAYSIDGVDQAIPRYQANTGMVWSNRDWYEPDSLATVTYSGGYAQADVPWDLQQAYAQCVATMAQAPIAGSTPSSGAPLKSLGLGGGAISIAFDTSASADATYEAPDAPPLLQPYAFTLKRFRSNYL